MTRFFWICLAGAAGTGCRYLIAVWTAQRLGMRINTFLQNCARARQQLTACLKKHGVTPEEHA